VASDTVNGETKIGLPAEVQHQGKIAVGFDYRYLREFFDLADGDVEILLKDTQTAGFFRPAEARGFQHFIMPLRI